MTLDRDSLLHNRYRILEILGEGGMGAVYKARDENLGVLVAVKENLFTTDEYTRQFRMEATILASLRHPNLTRVTDHFEEGEGQYLVMDFIEGEDLRDRMDRLGILEEEEISTIGRAICEALTYLHTRIPTILHRDIKPSNVRIAPNGQVFLVDFGLAKVVEGSQLTMTGARAMTPGYSPPEQYGTARTDARSDVYSLGATIYSAITGSLPEDGLARAMNQATLSPVRKLNPKISRKFANVIERALAVHPEERYQTAEDFKKALAGVSGISRRRSKEPLTVSPPPSAILDDVLSFAIPESSTNDLPSNVEIPSIKLSPQQPKVISPAELKPASSIAIAQPLPISKPVTRPDAESMFESSPANETKKKKPIGCMPVLFVIFLLVGGSAFLSYLFYPNEVEDALAFFLSPSGVIPTPMAMTPTEPEAATATEPLNTPETVTIQTKETQVPVDTPTTLPSPSSTPTNTPTPTRVPTNTSMPTEEPTPFGGSGQIVFASKNPTVPQLFIINADGTDLRPLTDLAAGACQPDWSPDDWIVFTSPCSEEKDEYPGSNLWLIHADGSGLEQLTTSIHGDYDPDWSPDGTKIVFTSLRSGNAQIYLLTMEDRKNIKALTSKGIKNIHPSFSPDGARLTFISTRNGPFQIWTMNSDGSEQKRLSRSGELKNLWPVFSRDGENIIFTQRPASGFPRLVVVSVSDDGYGESVLVDRLIPRRAAAVSPDGLWLVYETWPFGENHDIYVMTSEGEQITQVTTRPNYDFDPAWRPIP